MTVTLNRIKNKKHPPIPRSLKKIRDVLNSKAILSKYGNTLDKKRKFYAGTVVAEAYTFTVFVSFKTVDMIERYIKPVKRRYLMDGTFKIRPKLFYQLLIITIEYKNDVNMIFYFIRTNFEMCSYFTSFLLYKIFPVFYILMTSKSSKCYSSVFQYIEENIFEMKPAEFITDFESGMRKALNRCYSNVIIRGCWYHFCCAITRNMVSLGLNSLLRSNPKAKMIKNEILSLPLLPKEQFCEGFNHIKRQVKEFGLESNFESFFEYFKYWLNEVCA